MNRLSQVLLAKFVLTVFAWCLPLLLLSEAWLEKLGFVVPQPLVFLRLLGMAYGALLVGYGLGLLASIRATYPRSTVWVGIVSNGGACLVLSRYAIAGAWSGWGAFAQVFMWSSLLGTAAIALGLVAFGPLNLARTRWT